MLIIFAYEDDEYEGLSGPGEYIGRAKNTDALPDIKDEKDIVMSLTKRGREATNTSSKNAISNR